MKLPLRQSPRPSQKNHHLFPTYFQGRGGSNHVYLAPNLFAYSYWSGTGFT
jgi:hypothetical protein